MWPKSHTKRSGRRPHVQWLIGEVWRDVRPYLRALIGKSLILALFWLCDYGFFRLTKVLTIDDWEGRLVAEVHSVTTTLAFAVLGILFALDVIEIRRRPH